MHLLSRLTDLLYPPACVLCHKSACHQPGILICAACRSTMPRSQAPVCDRCGVTLPGAFDAVVRCQSCQRHPRAFHLARAPWHYAGSIQEAIQQFKYQRRWRIGSWLATEMASCARRSLPLDDIETVVPVPSHWLKRRLRGRDPSRDLSQALSRLLEKPHHPTALRQTRWTHTQTRLSWMGRFRNVRRAFAARGRLVHDKTVLLVDDVLTSGATAHACAQALREAGARRVFVLTAARTPSRH